MKQKEKEVEKKKKRKADKQSATATTLIIERSAHEAENSLRPPGDNEKQELGIRLLVMFVKQ